MTSRQQPESMKTPSRGSRDTASLHASPSARRLQQHSCESKSRSRHHALPNGAEKARPVFSHARGALLPLDNHASASRFRSRQLLPGAVSPRQASCKRGHLVDCRPWLSGSTSPKAPQHDRELSVGELHAPSPRGEEQRGLAEDRKLRAGVGDTSHRIRVNSLHQESILLQ